MRVTVFGGTGGTGLHVVDQALGAGNEVRAVVRNPEPLGPPRPGLDVVVADVMDPDAIVDAVTACDVAVSCIGSRDGLKPTTVCEDSARSIIAAMHRAGARRLVVVSASGPFIDDGDGPFMRYLLKPLVQRILKHGFADFVAMESVVRNSGLDWTIVRPPRLTNKPPTGRYRTRVERNLKRGFTLPRADLAQMILDACANTDARGAAIFVAS